MATSMTFHGVLSVMSVCFWSCFNLAQTQTYREVTKVTWHLSGVCADFKTEVMNENYLCNAEVIDEVHEHAENIQITGYNGDLVEVYLDAANAGRMCYSDGVTIRTMTGACDCMNRVCDRAVPIDVDYCSSIVLNPLTPNVNGSFANYGKNHPFNCRGIGCRGRAGLVSGSDALSTPLGMTFTSIALAMIPWMR